jgi:hypothetical protein
MISTARAGVFCDYCKDRWGGRHVKGVWEWHEKARRQAVVTITSVTIKAKGTVRSYCGECREIVSNWPDGTVFPLSEQVEQAIKAESPLLKFGVSQ